uniref:C-type lectin domain-containing protein n=1 Tax=Amphilophus citrinellus TaxID=61819 RepID=A0A3Q0RL47_AMPCI
MNKIETKKLACSCWFSKVATKSVNEEAFECLECCVCVCVCVNKWADTAVNKKRMKSSEKPSWNDAQSYCRENYTDLATVRNQSENKQLKMMVTSYTWIGLYRNSWKWSDGSAYSFINWANKISTRVTASCASFFGVGNWLNSECKYLRPFVCNTGEF